MQISRFGQGGQGSYEDEKITDHFTGSIYRSRKCTGAGTDHAGTGRTGADTGKCRKCNRYL